MASYLPICATSTAAASVRADNLLDPPRPPSAFVGGQPTTCVLSSSSPNNDCERHHPHYHGKSLISNNSFKCSLPHTVLFCIARSVLSLPLTHIGRVRRWWAIQGMHLAFFLQDPPKTCIIGLFLACPWRLLWKRGTKWRSLICSPLLPNFNITSGHLHFCVNIPPTTLLSQDYWGGKIQRL